MCRLAIFGGIEDFKDVARSLNQLEQSLGGDGNGYYRPADPMVMKGLDLTTAEVAFASYGRSEPTYFHTRMATAGYIGDANCHPFVCGDEGMLLHNGHWHHYSNHNKAGEASDTQTAARLVGKHGLGILQSRSFDYSGVWIVASEAGAYVTVNGGDFYFQWAEDGGYFHASEPIMHISMAEIRVALQGETYFVDNDGSVSVVTDSIERVRMPKARRHKKKTKKGKRSKKTNFKSFSGSTETNERGSEDMGGLREALEKMDRQDDFDRLNELRDVADIYGYDTLTEWEQEQLDELDRQLEDDDFFSNIKPTSWED